MPPPKQFLVQYNTVATVKSYTNRILRRRNTVTLHRCGHATAEDVRAVGSNASSSSATPLISPAAPTTRSSQPPQPGVLGSLSSSCALTKTVPVTVEWPFYEQVILSDLSDDLRCRWGLLQCGRCVAWGGRCGLKGLLSS
ncbi:hypothetical protein NL676_017936 [Syzygium grande]|nr:hypothetical protein NL676_017936 [Syzygium grande]